MSEPVPRSHTDGPTDMDAANRTVAETLAATPSYVRERSYAGWDSANGPSGRPRRALPVESR